MRTLKTELAYEGHRLQRNRMFLNHKIIHTPFFVSSPHSAPELDLICELLNMNSEEESYVDSLHGICYRAFEYDTVVRNQNGLLNQLDLDLRFLNRAFRYLNGNALKIIDPCTELYRHRFSKYLNSYISLPTMPSYFRDFISILLDAPRDSLDRVHLEFWRSLFSPKRGRDNIERLKIGHFIQAHDDFQREKETDVFVPPVPFITLQNCHVFTDYTIQINMDAFDLVDRDVAAFFCLDSKVFADKQTIKRIVNYIANNPSECKLVLFKILWPERILEAKYGKYALKNLEFLLMNLRMIRKEEENPRIYGMINGGGFGYCLLGAGFDFFTDSVSHYWYYYPRKKKTTHKKSLDPDLLIPRTFEDAEAMFSEWGESPLPYLPFPKYQNARNFNKYQVSPEEWRRDVKLAGIVMWNEYVNEIIRAMDRENNLETLFFEKVLRSAYSRLAPIIRRTISI